MHSYITFALFLANYEFVKSQNAGNHYATIKDHMIIGEAPITMVTRSRVECSTRCSENYGCLATNYFKPNCSLFNVIASEYIAWQSGYAVTCKCCIGFRCVFQIIYYTFIYLYICLFLYRINYEVSPIIKILAGSESHPKNLYNVLINGVDRVL